MSGLDAAMTHGFTKKWVAGVGVAVMAAALVLILPSGAPASVMLIDGGEIIAIGLFLWAVHRMPQGVAGVWWLFWAAQALTVAGDLVYDIQRYGFDQDPFPGMGDPFYLLSYVAQFAALNLLVHKLYPGRDREAWIDSAIMALAAASLVVTFVVVPMAKDADVTAFARAVGVAYPLLDLALLAVLIRLLVGGGRPNPALALITVSVGFVMIADLSFNVFAVAGVVEQEPRWVASLFMLSVLTATAAATGPGARSFTTPLVVSAVGPTRKRLLGLVVGSLTTPVVLVGVAWDRADFVGRTLAGATIVVFILVLWRVELLLATVESQARQLERLARVDALTGLPNRRSWDQEIQRVGELTASTGLPLTVAILDLDHFKRYNDEHGHQAGDALLAACADAWRAELEPPAMLARYGGEEFAVLLPGLHREGARLVLERVRQATPGTQTVSIGFAEREVDEPEARTLNRADRALYLAKEAGRDQVMADDEQLVEARVTRRRSEDQAVALAMTSGRPQRPAPVTRRQTGLTVTGMALMTGKPVIGS